MTNSETHEAAREAHVKLRTQTVQQVDDGIEWPQDEDYPLPCRIAGCNRIAEDGAYCDIHDHIIGDVGQAGER